MNKSIQEMAVEIARVTPAMAVILPDCPNHEGHRGDCWNAGYSAGFDACVTHVEKRLIEVLAGLEGQVAT